MSAIKLQPPVWLMFTKDGFYPIHPSTQCKPEDHGSINPHVFQITDIDGKVLWVRAAAALAGDREQS